MVSCDPSQTSLKTVVLVLVKSLFFSLLAFIGPLIIQYWFLFSGRADVATMECHKYMQSILQPMVHKEMQHGSKTYGDEEQKTKKVENYMERIRHTIDLAGP